MSRDAVPAVGASIILSLDGQKVTGKVTAVQADKLVVKLTILQMAKAYQGVKARSILPDGTEVNFDLGGAAYYSELLIEVPLPVGTRAVSTPRSGIDPVRLPAAGPAAPPAAAFLVTPDAAAPAPAAFPSQDAAEVATTAKSAALEAALSKPALNKVVEEPPKAPPVPPPAPANKPADERRHFFRFAVDCPVEIIESVGHSREYVREEGHTVNLSGGGMLVQFAKPLAPGTYRFRLQLPEETMVLTGRLVKKGDGTSRVAPIEFVDLHESDRSKLIRFIFNMMRNLKQAARGLPLDGEKPIDPKAEKQPKEKAYWRRREKYFKSAKIRYW